MNNVMQDGFAGFVQENQYKFYRLAYSYVKNQEEALDLVQEAPSGRSRNCRRSVSPLI